MNNGALYDFINPDEAVVTVQDNSTKSVIETPPSETWQIKFHPASDSLIIAAAGGSSSKIALWSADDAQPKGHLGIPAVSPSHDGHASDHQDERPVNVP